MCNVVLINSPLFNDKQPSIEDTLPPLGLGYIASNLQENGIDVELIDAVYENLSIAELSSVIKEKNPQYVGINIFTTNYELVQEFVVGYDIQTNFIIGGPITKHVYESILKWPTSNTITIIIGEADYFVSRLLLGEIKEKPLVVLENKAVYEVKSSSPSFPNDISDISLNRSFFKNEPVLNHFGLYEASIISSRGCIHNCAFCGAARSQNKNAVVRERSAESILAEIRNIKNIYPSLRSIRVLDDLFLRNRKSIEKATSLFELLNLNWRAMAHVVSFRELPSDMYRLLKNSGCLELFVGIESGSPKIRDMINKIGEVNEINNTIQNLLSGGINVKGYFIYGFPGENVADFSMTYDLACKLKEISLNTPGNFRVSVFEYRPYHGTQLYNILSSRNKEQIKPIIPNSMLSEVIGRKQFNFHSKNFSDASDEELNMFIIKTNALNQNQKLNAS